MYRRVSAYGVFPQHHRDIFYIHRYTLTPVAMRSKAEIPLKQFPRSILVTSSRGCRYANMSRGNRACRACQKGCCEDAADLPATSRTCRAREIWRTTRHTDKRAEVYTAADRRPTNQVSAWQAERRVAQHPRGILMAMWRVSTRMPRGNCCRGFPALLSS